MSFPSPNLQADRGKERGEENLNPHFLFSSGLQGEKEGRRQKRGKKLSPLLPGNTKGRIQGKKRFLSLLFFLGTAEEKKKRKRKRGRGRRTTFSVNLIDLPGP